MKRCYILICSLVNISLTHETYIRSRYAVKTDLDDDNDDNEPLETRDLGWNFIQNEYDDDRWYNSYDWDDIPDREYGDDPDFIRDTDLCFGDNGKLSRNNCPKPPDCTEVDKRYYGFGKAMLCINRAPLTHDQNVFYIAAMKCIPRFENCDKCFCGTLRRSDGMDGYCKFDETGADDDRVDFDCDELDQIEMMGHKYSFSHSKGGDNIDTMRDKSKDSDNIDTMKDESKDSEDGEIEIYLERLSKGGIFSQEDDGDDDDK